MDCPMGQEPLVDLRDAKQFALLGLQVSKRLLLSWLRVW